MTSQLHTPASRPSPRRAARRQAWVAAAALAAAVVALAVGVLVLGPAPQARASEATLFNIGGRGWGHGIGLSQYGAYGYAKAGWGYKSIIRHYYTDVRFGTTPNATVRVLLASGQSDARVTSREAYKVTDGTTTRSIPGGVLATVTWTGTAYRVTAGESSWVFPSPVTFKRGTSLLRLYNRNANGWPYDSDGARYRGSLRVVRSDSAFLIVNHVALEGYLCGVVPREMPSSWPQAALRAQAVAARSYAVRGIKKLTYFDLYCTAASQVYNGYDGEADSTNLAVSVTAGIVPTYAGTPIVAYFSSTSGGHTENIENVWGGSAVPYLKGVLDPYDYYSPYHVWEDAPYRWSAATVTAKLGSLVQGTLRTIYVAKRGVSPRVVLAYVLGTDGTTAHLASAASGWTLRNKLGLRDSWFWVRTMSVSPAMDDEVKITYGDRILLEGRSYPTIGVDKRITLRYYRDDVWKTTTVSDDRTLRKTFSFVYDGSTKSGTCVDYSFLGKPGRTTTYQFLYGQSRSPQTTIMVRPLVTATFAPVAPAVGETVTFSGAVLPLTRVGSLIRLQRYVDGVGWETLVESTIGAEGLYSIDWIAEAGTHQFRVTVPAGDQMIFGLSPTLTVIVE